MVSDASRWNEKYAAASLASALRVEPLLESHQRDIDGLLEPRTALDIAAGTCHAAVYLAKRGLHATALDCSAVGLGLGEQLAKREGVAIKTTTKDLTVTKLPGGPWSVICCFRYLDRNLFPQMAAGLAPGGLLFYRTFNVHHLKKATAFNPEYVLQPGELNREFSTLDILSLSDGDDPEENTSWIAARRPA